MDPEVAPSSASHSRSAQGDRGPSPLVVAVTLAVLSAAVGVTLWRLGGSGAGLKAYMHDPELRWDASCRVTAVARADHAQQARKALREAEAALRDMESRTIVDPRDSDSEIARFNAASAGAAVRLSPMTLEVLREARQIHQASRGAFDVTVLPLVRLWQRAFKDSRLPSQEEIRAARDASTWNLIELSDEGAAKKADAACVDLTGIARGYAVDRAAAAMAAAGINGGRIDLAGTVRCFGIAADAPEWQVPIRDPFTADANVAIACLKLTDAAVSVSSNYRTSVIDGRAYGTLIDSNTGWPAVAAPSATVVAPTAMEAQAWSIALAVLGPRGLECIPKGSGIEAMVITGTPRSWKVAQTAGFDKLLSVKPDPAGAAAMKATPSPTPKPSATPKPSPTPKPAPTPKPSTTKRESTRSPGTR